MRARTRLNITLAAAVVWFCGGNAAWPQISPDVSDKVAAAVVEITATNCSGLPHERTGTGFAFGSADQIVTANHVVAGCGQIELWYERTDGQPRRAASVTHVLIDKDLALLHVDEPPNSSALSLADNVDRAEPLKAIGYAVGQPTLGDLDLAISIGSNILRDMLPPENRAEISRETGIDLLTTIYRFSRPLYPGMSGGPIFDANGNVVAIVAGGLKNGAVAASWGWPAKLLQSLRTSKDSTASSANVSQTQFAYGGRSEPQSSIRCGQLDFVQSARVSFAEIAASSDNSLRLSTTVNFSGSPRSEIEKLQFDIWVHKASGATVVVPASAALQQYGGGCVARSADGLFYMVVWGSPASNAVQAQQAALAFENNLMTPIAMPNIGFYADQVLSFNGPETRQDGLMVNRRAFFVGKQNLAPGRALAIHQFETLMARGGSFVGVATINSRVDLCWNAAGRVGLCSFDPNYVEEWAYFVLATQMSTYPLF